MNEALPLFPTLLTPQKVARLLRVREAVVIELVRSGDLPGVEIGKDLIRIPEALLLEWFNARVGAVSARQVKPKPAAGLPLPAQKFANFMQSQELEAIHGAATMRGGAVWLPAAVVFELYAAAGLGRLRSLKALSLSLAGFGWIVPARQGGTGRRGYAIHRETLAGV